MGGYFSKRLLSTTNAHSPTPQKSLNTVEIFITYSYFYHVPNSTLLAQTIKED